MPPGGTSSTPATTIEVKDLSGDDDWLSRFSPPPVGQPKAGETSPPAPAVANDWLKDIQTSPAMPQKIEEEAEEPGSGAEAAWPADLQPSQAEVEETELSWLTDLESSTPTIAPPEVEEEPDVPEWLTPAPVEAQPPVGKASPLQEAPDELDWLNQEPDFSSSSETKEGPGSGSSDWLSELRGASTLFKLK
jgi:hypothetical protein